MTQPAARYFLVLPAAGSGRRMEAEVPKQYLPLAGRSLLQHSIERLGQLPEFERVAIALAAHDPRWASVAQKLTPELFSKVLTTTGGSERMASVRNALAALQPYAADDDWILVHDAVRPCIHPRDVRNLMHELANAEAGGLLGLPVRETLKQSDGKRFVERTVDRSNIWQAATPQMFRFGILKRGLDQAVAAGQDVKTDEAAAVEALGLPVRLVAGRADNLKITYPEDLLLAAAILDAQARELEQ